MRVAWWPHIGLIAFGIGVLTLVSACSAVPRASSASISKGPDSVVESSGGTNRTGFRILSLKDTIELEHSDRVKRIKRLSNRADLPHPVLDSSLVMPADALPTIDYDVPVVRIRYPAVALFDVDSAKLKPQAKRALRAIAKSMRLDIPDVHVLVVGHTDSTASVAYNQQLSEQRARNAVQYLERFGVRPKQTDFLGMSERQPIASNDTPQGRANNRRVEFLISSYKEANIHFARTRSIICDYLDPDEFDRDACLRLGEPRLISLSSDDRNREIDIDPTAKEIKAAVQRRQVESMGEHEIQSPLTDRIPISPPERTVSVDHESRERDIDASTRTREIVLAPPVVYEIRIEDNVRNIQLEPEKL